MTESEKLESAIAILEAMKKQFLGETRNVIDRAIKALEKQIPKKPNRWESGHACCCSCKRGIVREDNYCCYCGQAIDWSE